MTIIDTLKLARDLRERAGFGQAAAEATAEALNTALGDRMPSKADLDQAIERLEHVIAQNIRTSRPPARRSGSADELYEDGFPPDILTFMPSG